MSRSLRLRSVMSFLVHRIATGRPRASRCRDHRLDTVTGVPSALLLSSSPSQRPVRSTSARISGVYSITSSARCRERLRDPQPEDFRGLEVDDQFELGGLLDG